jgi:hypothetical protein
MRAVAGALGGLLEFLDHPVALELRDVVDEEDAVEVVDLVLQHRGQKALGQDFSELAFAVEGAGAHGGGPLDLGVIFRNAEAALFVGRALLGRPHDLGIDEHLRVRRFLLLRHVDHQEADRLGDLDRRQADAGRFMHGLDHVVDQAAQRIVDRFDLPADEAQLGVGQNDDRSLGHEAGLFSRKERRD